MTILQHSIAQAAAAATSYQIARSLRFNSADSAYLNRTFGAVGNRSVWTWSGWIKRSKISAVQRLFCGGNGGLLFQANDTFLIDYDGGTNYAATPAVYRDVGAHCHVHVVLDTTQATATNRIKFWLNGVQQTLSFTGTIPLNGTGVVNNSVVHYIGTLNASSQYCDLMATDIRFIDGQALDPTSFGQFDSATGVWVPKAYTGTYGTNGFWLKLDDNSNTTAATLGKDSSGNANNWTPNNFSVTAGVGNDSLVDSPTNYGTDTGVGGEVRGNYATLNPLNNPGGTFSNGNLDWASPSTDQRIALSSISIDGSSKWYAEATAVSKSGTYYAVGVFGNPQTWNPRLLYRSDGARWIDGTAQTPNWASYTDNDVIGIAYDGSTGVASFYKNGTLQGSMTTTSPTSTLYFGCSSDGTGNSTSMNYSWNFGQRPFANTAPSGFKALCTQNLPTPAIGASSTTLANQQFDVSLYSGNSSTQNIVNAGGFKPDLVWIKGRSSAWDHMLYDAVRGVNINLRSNLTNAEATGSPSEFTAFNSNGFTVVSNGTQQFVNLSGSTYAAWQWKGGNGTVSNTAGSITSTVSANQTAGISVVTYTGTGANATVGHGLGAVPKMIIAKNRDSALNWIVYHANIGAANTLVLNTTAASAADAAWQGVTPTSTVFSLGVTGSGNENTKKHVAYCFAEVPGFSKFGSYTGNASTDGPFVYTGFRVRWLMLKRTDVANDWVIYDAVRNTYNVMGNSLAANTSGAESGLNLDIDFLSNGFKLRTSTAASENASGGTYIYAAFAEAPFNYARAR